MFAAKDSLLTRPSGGGYQISRSLRFNSADSAYLNRTPATATNRRTWTWSAWVKRSALGAIQELFDSYWANNDNGYFWVGFTGADAFEVQLYNSTLRTTTQVFRDPSAWYHLVLAIDTTQATAANRVKVYLNGSEITTFSTNNAPTQNLDTAVNYNGAHYIGTFSGSSNLFNGYMTEVNLIDGSQLTPSSFGQTNADTGVWQPKAYSGSYGTNGFYLNFSDNSNTTAATLGKDYSGNGNNWTPNNFSVTAGAGNDSLVDSPTSYGTDTGVGGTVRGNYATLNPLLVITTSGVTNPTLANGNLSFVGNATTDTSGRSTIGMTSGTWYAEITISYVSAIQDGLGIAYTQSDSSRTFGVLYRTNGNKLIDNTATAYGSSYAAGDVIGIAVDATNNQVTFYKNGTSQGAISFTPTTAIYFSTYGTNVSPAFAGDINFGQRPFAYTAPSGFKALCTQNLPTPTIGATTATQAGKFFNPATYTGNGSTNSITTVGFQPDWTWLKNRSVPAVAGNHFATDAVRGAGIGIYPNLTDAEANNTTLFTGFTSTGFNVAGTNSSLNENGVTYVSWNWKANGSGSSNTAGSITSTVSANTTSGFSVVTYTGTGANATVGHGLGVAPSIILFKNRSAVTNWVVYNINATSAAASARPMYLNTINGEIANGAMFNHPSTNSSTIFNIGTDSTTNGSGNSMVAYCFTPIAGYFATNIFTGNGSADGPFVYCGFRPAYVLIKDTTNNGDWFVWDTARDTYNVSQYTLLPNSSAAETSGSANYIDILSNGFKVKATTAGFNGSTDKFLFMAFASAPFKFSLAR